MTADNNKNPNLEKIFKKAKVIGIDLESGLEEFKNELLPKLEAQIVDKVMAQIPQMAAQPVNIQEIVKEVIAQLPQSQPIDTQEIVKQVLLHMPLPEEIDEEALIQKVALRLVERLNDIQSKLEEPMTEIKKSMLTLAQSLKIIQENQTNLIQDEVNKIFQANQEALNQTFSKLLETKLKEMLPASQDAGSSGSPIMQTLNQLFMTAFENIDKITELVKATKGGQSAMSIETVSFTKGLTMGERLVKGQLSVADIAKELIPGATQP